MRYFLQPFYAKEWTEVSKDDFIRAMLRERYLFGTPDNPTSLFDEMVADMPEYPGLMFSGKVQAVTPVSSLQAKIDEVEERAQHHPGQGFYNI